MLDLTPFLHDWAYPLLALLATGFVMWIVGQSAKWLNAHAGFLDAQTRHTLMDLEQRSIEQGVQIVLAWVRATGDANAKVKIDSAVVRLGAQYAINHSGSILKSRGADPDLIAAQILAKLPPAMVDTDTTGATVKTVPIEVAHLPPIH